MRGTKKMSRAEEKMISLLFDPPNLGDEKEGKSMFAFDLHLWISLI